MTLLDTLLTTPKLWVAVAIRRKLRKAFSTLNQQSYEISTTLQYGHNILCHKFRAQSRCPFISNFFHWFKKSKKIFTKTFNPGHQVLSFFLGQIKTIRAIRGSVVVAGASISAHRLSCHCKWLLTNLYTSTCFYAGTEKSMSSCRSLPTQNCERLHLGHNSHTNRGTLKAASQLLYYLMS